MEKIDVFIGARAGSERVRNKNTRKLNGKPLISYTIETALELENIDNIVVSSNDQNVKDIIEDYKEVILIDRPDSMSGSTSLDIQWILHLLESQEQDVFIKLAPTSPFREKKFIQESLNKFLANKNFDSARAVKLCTEHPGKMWKINGNKLEELDTNLEYEKSTPMHAGQYQDLPQVYVQTSSLEIARSSSVIKYRTREGKNIMPLVSSGINAFAIDYERDFFIAEEYLKGNIQSDQL